MKFNRAFAFVFAALAPFAAIAFASCSSGSDETKKPDERPMIVKKFPFLENKNAWVSTQDFSEYKASGKDVRHSLLGYYGVGNGASFALLGATNPLWTLHSPAGPTYQVNDEGFFGDVAFSLYVKQNGGYKEAFFDKQRAWRVKNNGVICADGTTADMAETGVVSVFSLTFAPVYDAKSAPEILQYFEIKNETGADISDLFLYVKTYGDNPIVSENSVAFSKGGGTMKLSRIDGETTGAGGGDAALPAGGFGTPLAKLAAGQSASFWLSVSFYKDKDGGAKSAAVKSAAEAEIALAAASEWWGGWFAKAPSLDTPDAKTNDLFESVLYTIKSQQSFTGGVTPMSHYTSTWIRDTYGPARFFFRIGLIEDALAMAKYYHKAASIRGDIGNSLDNDIAEELKSEPDWLAMGPFTGRQRGEGPSHIPLMFKEYMGNGGDAGQVAPLVPFLLRSLLAQGMTGEGLMYFSGDETWRPGEATNLGMPTSYPFEDKAYSAESAMLYVAASRWLESFIASYSGSFPFDKTQILTRLEERRVKAEKTLAADGAYWLEESKSFAPWIYMEDGRPETRPSPDVNTMPLWLNVLNADDARAKSSAEAMYAAIGKPDGLVQNANGDDFELLGFKQGQGIYTGMAVGYWLYNVSALGMSELAEKVFNAAHKQASCAGEFPEDGVYGQFEPLQLQYYKTGGMGDIWARYRPWEGAINAEAIWFYLTGLDKLPASQADFKPRFPNGWTRFCVNNVSVGGVKKRVCFDK